MKRTLLPLSSSRRLGVFCSLVAASASLCNLAPAATPGRIRTAAAPSLMSHFAVRPLATDGLRQSEQGFLEAAAERTRREMRLADFAAAQAANADLRAAALQLAADQRQLRDAIEALMRKNGIGVPTGEPQAPEEYQRLSQLSGASFDREVISLLAKVHEELVTLFEQAASDSKDAEVRALAAGQLPMVRDHRQQLIELKKVYE